jgi:hypothetical protein
MVRTDDLHSPSYSSFVSYAAPMYLPSYSRRLAGRQCCPDRMDRPLVVTQQGTFHVGCLLLDTAVDLTTPNVTVCTNCVHWLLPAASPVAVDQLHTHRVHRLLQLLCLC